MSINHNITAANNKSIQNHRTIKMFLAGAGLTYLCGTSIKSSIKKYEEIQKQKTKLINDIVDYDQMHTKANGDDFILNVYNRAESAKIDIFKKNMTQFVPIMTQRGDFEIIHIKPHLEWQKILSQGANLNLGLNNFIPPNNLNNVIGNSSLSVTMESDGIGIMNNLENSYKQKYILSNDDKYRAKIMPFTNKNVYSYGKLNNNNFHAEVMGLSPQTVTNKVFEHEEQDANDMFCVGTLGAIIGVGMIISSIGRN